MPDTNGSIIERLSKIDTPTLSNAIEKLEVRNPITGFASRELRCWYPELPPMCGVAITAQVETINAEDPGGLNEAFVDLCEAIATEDRPSVVVFQETGPQPAFSAHIGEVLATTFKHYGAKGLVTDSTVRDIHEVRALGFQYFATGAVASHGAFRVVRAQVPVTVCGLSIQPGNLLHGDVNGLISVPESGRERLPKLAQQVVAAERELMDLIQNGDSIRSLRDRLVH